MRITRTNLDEAVFFGLAGKLTVNADLAGLHDAARQISDPDIRGIVVDLEEVTRLDCWGIGQLIRLRSNVVASGRAFGLVNVDPHQRSLLRLLRIPSVCRIYGSRQEALSGFAPVVPPLRIAGLKSVLLSIP